MDATDPRPMSRTAKFAAIAALGAIGLIVTATLATLILTKKFVTVAGSMSPALEPGEYVAFAPYWLIGEPQRGDVATFWTNANSDSRTVWIKRIIGVPGDFIALHEGEVLLNGEPVPRREIPPVTLQDWPLPQPAFEETLPSGPTYVVLDLDPQGQLDNTAEVEVPPGKYFVMGDNRDNSYDSRSEKVGLVSRDDLIGKAVIRYFSADTTGLRFDRIGTRVR